MAFDEYLAEIFRHSLRGYLGVSEKRMFGGLCFMLNGNMLCGVSRTGGMARVGKDNEAEALALDGVGPLSFTGRKMGGFVDVGEDAMENGEVREAVLELAIEFVGALPPKPVQSATGSRIKRHK